MKLTKFRVLQIKVVQVNITDSMSRRQNLFQQIYTIFLYTKYLGLGQTWKKKNPLLSRYLIQLLFLLYGHVVKDQFILTAFWESDVF